MFAAVTDEFHGDGIRTANLMLHRLIVIAVVVLCSFVGGKAAAQEAIGAVSRIQGEAHGTHGGTTRALGLNASVFLNETVSKRRGWKSLSSTTRG
jgi:hypothetical protein